MLQTKRKSPLLVYSLTRSSFNQGSWARFPAGSQRIVNLCGACMPREYTGKVSGEGDVRFVTIWGRKTLPCRQSNIYLCTPFVWNNQNVKCLLKRSRTHNLYVLYRWYNYYFAETVTCLETHLKCDNHFCIPHEKGCDYKDDCGDNSDEADCSEYRPYQNISMLLKYR